ncbi:MAG: hypothetical protein JWP38_3695 [Herbaspirillum sp.]|nr:hypothetical protein [Herbaspirillum sp.]
MSAPVTQWFKGTPVKVGVWNTRDREDHQDENFQYWNGQRWSRCMGDPHTAFHCRSDPSFFQHNEWRGLADDPAEADGIPK